MASSFSHGLAFIVAKGERTTTFTSSPPSRRAVRQQSIAVLPPPRTMTRLPIFAVCSNATLCEPIDAEVNVRFALPDGPADVEITRARCTGADKDRVVILIDSTPSCCRRVAA